MFFGFHAVQQVRYIELQQKRGSAKFLFFGHKPEPAPLQGQLPNLQLTLSRVREAKQANARQCPPTAQSEGFETATSAVLPCWQRLLWALFQTFSRFLRCTKPLIPSPSPAVSLQRTTQAPFVPRSQYFYFFGMQRHQFHAKQHYLFAMGVAGLLTCCNFHSAEV